MDTEKFFSFKEIDIEKVNVYVLSDEDRETVAAYVELTRHLQELKQLFDMFRFNLEDMLNTFEIFANDIVRRKAGANIKSSDFIAVNALTINLISSGRTVTDSAEACMKNSYGENSEEICSFKENCLSKIYDENFGYRFLYHMRNFSQHLHLPVSCSGGRYCFDLWQIINTPHMKSNAALKQELTDLNKRAIDNHNSVFHASFCITLAQYTYAVSHIYYEFLRRIKRRLLELKKELMRSLNENPVILNHEDERFNGNLLYMMSEEDTTIHMFDPDDHVEKMHSNHLKEAKKFYNTQKREHNAVIKGVKWKSFNSNSASEGERIS